MRLLIILALVFAFVLVAISATLTVEIPTNDVPRVSEAYGSIYNLGHNASMQEVSKATQGWIIQSTQDYERRKNMALYTPTPMEMQPTPTPTPTPAPPTPTPVPPTPSPTP
jgi:hypothetical protein